MNATYNHILIPVDNAPDTQKAVARAISLASPGQSIIHLAQLIHTWNPLASLTPATAYEAGTGHTLDSYIKSLVDLIRWKDLIREHTHIAQVKIHIMRGPSMEVFLQEVTGTTPIDLIIITRGTKRRWRPGAHPPPGDRLARETHCAVLSLNTHIKRGIREEHEMLSEPLVIPHNDGHSEAGRFAMATGYSLLTSN